MPGQEIAHLVVERQCPHPHVIRGDAFPFQEETGFGHGLVRGAVSDDTHLRAGRVHHGARQVLPAQTILLLDAVHHAVPHFRVFRITGIRIMARAPGEVSRAGTSISHHRTVGDAVPIHVQVAAPRHPLLLFPPLQVFLPEDFAPVHRLLGIAKGPAHPVVHAQVQVAHHEHHGLETLCDVESPPAKLEGFVDVGGEEQDVFGIAVAGKVGQKNVALLRSGGQAGAGADPLHVPHHHGHFGVIGQTNGLGHQADTGARGGGHGPEPGPSRANGHVDGRELVLGLDDREGVLSVGPFSEAAQVMLQGFRQVRGRRDGVPTDELHTAEKGAQCRRGVAIAEDEAPGGLHGLHPIRVSLFQVVLGPAVGTQQHVVVHFRGFLALFPKMILQGRAQSLQVHAQQPGQDAHVDHVGHVIPQAWRRTGFPGQPVRRHGIGQHVLAQTLGTNVVGVQEHPPGHHFLHVIVHRGRIHGDYDFVGFPPGHESVLVHPNGIPGGQTLNVGRKDVLPGNRNAHAKQGPKDGQVGGLASGTVDGPYGDGKVVHHFTRDRLYSGLRSVLRGHRRPPGRKVKQIPLQGPSGGYALPDNPIYRGRGRGA